MLCSSLARVQEDRANNTKLVSSRVLADPMVEVVVVVMVRSSPIECQVSTELRQSEIARSTQSRAEQSPTEVKSSSSPVQFSQSLPPPRSANKNWEK